MADPMNGEPEHAVEDSRLVHHVTFSPQFPGALGNICSLEEILGFALLRVVPFHEYEAIAVFGRVGDE